MKRRMTLIDLLALILIVCEIVFLCIEGYDWMNIHVRRGNDANYVNTCESESLEWNSLFSRWLFKCK